MVDLAKGGSDSTFYYNKVTKDSLGDDGLKLKKKSYKLYSSYDFLLFY
jgi:hypothetical protein